MHDNKKNPLYCLLAYISADTRASNPDEYAQIKTQINTDSSYTHAILIVCFTHQRTHKTFLHLHLSSQLFLTLSPS